MLLYFLLDIGIIGLLAGYRAFTSKGRERKRKKKTMYMITLTKNNIWVRKYIGLIMVSKVLEMAGKAFSSLLFLDDFVQKKKMTMEGPQIHVREGHSEKVRKSDNVRSGKGAYCGGCITLTTKTMMLLRNENCST